MNPLKLLQQGIGWVACYALLLFMVVFGLLVCAVCGLCGYDLLSKHRLIRYPYKDL